MPDVDSGRAAATLLDATPTADQRRLLQTLLWPVVQEHRGENDTWPTWNYVRRSLAADGIDAQRTFDSLPVLENPRGGSYGLVWRLTSRGGPQIRNDEMVGLSLAGLHHADTDRADRLAQLVALFAAQEAQLPVDPARVVVETVSFNGDAPPYLAMDQPRAAVTSITVRAAADLLKREPIPIAEDTGYQHQFQVVLGNGHLELLRGVSTVREYLVAVIEQAGLLPSTPTAHPAATGHDAADRSGGEDHPPIDHYYGGPGYELAWPKNVAAAELLAVSQRPRHGAADRARLLMDEMFTSAVPSDDLAAVLADSGTNRDDAAHQFLAALTQASDRFAESRRRPAYYGQDPAADDIDVQRSWRQIVADFRMAGYLEQAAPEGCEDDPPHRDQDDRLNSITRARIGLRDIWPITRMSLGDPLSAEDFYRLVELVGDLLARPRRRQDHAGCGWHYQEFVADPARSLYRARVNDLFDRAGVPLHLSDEGDDAGRLVHVAGDARDELVHRALAVQDDGDRADVAHAIRRFRDRTATREDKRAAVVALARVLENHRRLLEAELLSRDEGALFNIANNFDIRHRGANQHADYDEMYLDWLFWWYLATVELIDRLVARPPAAGS